MYTNKTNKQQALLHTKQHLTSQKTQKKKEKGGKHSTLLLFFCGRHLELIVPIDFFRCQCMLAITDFFGPIHEYFVGGTLCY